MRKQTFLLLSFVLIFNLPLLSYAEQPVISSYVEEEPVIDGFEEEELWGVAPPVVTNDPIADISLTLKTLHTKEKIFFLVSFPDHDESRTHKSWTWDNGRKIYTVGHDIEDIFVFKWNLTKGISDLSIYSDTSSRSDVWFWKACRTDPVGFADDKMHILSHARIEDARELTSKSGTTSYLMRKEDSGRRAYRTNMPVEYKADTLPRFINQKPSGSRADVTAKGNWRKGVWTIEFSRSLLTGNKDDVQFSTKAEYLFGVSRYEIAGRAKNQKLSQPLYGTGDVGERLTLRFKSN